MRARHAAGCASVVVVLSCAGAPADPRTASAPTVTLGAAPDKTSAGGVPADKSAGSALTDQAPVAFRADFSNGELGSPWNVFGAQNGNREVKGGKEGLWIKIADADRAWDAVGARTAKLKVEGDYDLRGRFRDFSARGNGSAKLIVVDAGNPKGEAAYVERVQIDGKNLFKFGGEVEGSLENWGFVATDATGGDLRIVRLGRTLRAYARADERASWSEFAQVQEGPK